MPSHAQIASARVSIKRTNEEEQAATVLTTFKESAGTLPWTQQEKEDYQKFFFFFFFLKSLNPVFANRHGRGADTYPDLRC